jgi:hypothetical protein
MNSNAWLAVAMLTVASEASADRIGSIYGGGGLSIHQNDQSGEMSNFLVGTALRFDQPGRVWSPRFAVDVRRMNGPAFVGIGDFTDARDPHGLGIRGLAGLQLHGAHGGFTWFGQLSIGIGWERVAYEEFARSRFPGDPATTRDVTDWGPSVDIEPAIGVAQRFGRFGLGGQLAYRKPTSAMPTQINDRDGSSPSVGLTLFLDYAL